MVQRRLRNTTSIPEPVTSSCSRSTSLGDSSNWWPDRWNILLLVMLYAIQGFPMGFVFGSIPFLLKENVGFDDIAVFALAGWPYSIKLVMAPIVDSVYSRRFGRRKSWIIPVQMISGSLMFVLGPVISHWVLMGNVYRLTPTFFLIMFLTSTQDIAVDAWALTLLQPRNLAFASTCQSIGLSIGYFATFTIFLALQDASFSNSYIRPWLGGSGAMTSLQQMLQTVGCFYIIATIVIWFKRESKSLNRGDVSPALSSSKRSSPNLRLEQGDDAGVDACDPILPPHTTRPHRFVRRILVTYSELFKVLKLPAVRVLLIVLLVAKTGFSAYDNVSALKLLDLGFPKQTMAMMAVIQAPVSLVGSVLGGRWAAQAGPVRPYLFGYGLRFLTSLTGPPLVRYFGTLNGVVTPLAFALVLITSIVYSIASECLMFVSAGALFLSISEKDIGGSYLTMLNTASNLGGMWHKSITLFLIDRMTIRSDCVLPAKASPGTKCPAFVDGYHLLSLCLVPVTVIVGVFVSNSLRRLVALPESAWRTARQ